MNPKVNVVYSQKIRVVVPRGGYKLGGRRMLPATVSKTVPNLPDERNPVVVRLVTRSELEAIPRDRYDVKVICVRVPSLETGEVGGEEELMVAITNSEQLVKQLKIFRRKYRVSLRKNKGGGDDGPPSNSLFNPPVREDLMADCIIQVMDNFFRGEENCSICNREYGRMDFCVLMHLFFKYIGFLKNESRLPYSTFLQEKVFAGKSKFGERTYNTYANKDAYQFLGKQLETLKVDFKKHPKLPPDPTESVLKPAFQEIGWAFQHSPYFSDLRELRNNLQKLDI